MAEEIDGGADHAVSSRKGRRAPEATPAAAHPQSPAAGFPGLNAILGFHIRLAHGAVQRHFGETFAQLDLTQKQVSVLWLVDGEPGISQIDVAQYLQMDRATTMAIVNRLQARNYLVRGRSTRDGRRQTLHLTEEGHVALAQARTAILEHETWLKSRFSAREVEKLTEFLTRIHG